MRKQKGIKAIIKKFDELKIIANFINFQNFKYTEIAYAKDFKDDLSIFNIDTNGAKISFLEEGYPEAVLKLKNGNKEWLEVVFAVNSKEMKKLYPSGPRCHYRCQYPRDVDPNHIYCDYRFPDISFDELYPDFKNDRLANYRECFLSFVNKAINEKIKHKTYVDVIKKNNNIKGILLIDVQSLFIETDKNRRDLLVYIKEEIDRKIVDNNKTFKEIYLYVPSYLDILNGQEKTKVIQATFYKIL